MVLRAVIKSDKNKNEWQRMHNIQIYLGLKIYKYLHNQMFNNFTKNIWTLLKGLNTKVWLMAAVVVAGLLLVVASICFK